MPHKLISVVLALWLAAGPTGCSESSLKHRGPATMPSTASLPPHVQGTIAQYARLDRAWDISLSGYGVVVGLGTKGSSEVPPGVEKYLTEVLLKNKIGLRSTGTEGLTPAQILQDKDTAIVIIGASMPIGSPVGTVFDVYVSAMPQTQTLSLVGGHLMPAELVIAPGGVAAPPSTNVQRFGDVSGAVFINPFIDPNSAEQSGKLREGRIIGGGTVTKTVSVRLSLKEKDYGLCVKIMQRINERFTLQRGSGDGDMAGERVANAVGPDLIELKIPMAYRKDYTRFLELVMHLPVSSDGSECEAHARRIAREMQQPTANHRELALVWEAMGRQMLPLMQSQYASTNSTAAFYAACAGLRLGDADAAKIVVKCASNANFPLRLEALEELGRHPTVAAGTDALRAMIDDDNDAVRLAAYEALRARRDETVARQIDLPGLFVVDVVACRRNYVVYATQTLERKIVIFGQNVPVERPIFFTMNDETVVIDATKTDDKLSVSRKIPRTGSWSEQMKVQADVVSLVRALGSPADQDDAGRIKGLSLSYGQIVSLLYQMCKQRDIPAKFVLQQSPESARMYQGAVTIGRPDSPE